MMKILYSPASYVHVSHIPEFFNISETKDATLLNFWLLRHKALTALPNDWQPNDAIVMLVLSYWHLIPITSHLIGGHLLRVKLTEQSSALISDSRLLAFISLPLRHQVNFKGTDPIDTISLGASFILHQLHELPEALYQRLILHFPAEMRLPNIFSPRTLNHRNLLRMALSYARHYY
ncbi:type III secretion protein [Enterobacter cloacae]|uniref:type III secretion protein n=1 Tax=Enterobacter cloacae TaxID=550 RepID=UPI002FF44866